MKQVARDGLVLLGCGKMGSALLARWLVAGLPAASVWVIEPNPSDWLRSSGVHLNKGVPLEPAVAVLAVKPQIMSAALPSLVALANGRTLFVSIAAGTTIAAFEAILGDRTPIVRTMPNTPAMVNRGITALCKNAHVTDAGMALAVALMGAVGETVILDGEHQIDAVTAVSGSGPAYVFHLIEAMATAGEAEGLSHDLAMRLARATVCGAGELAYQSKDSAAQLVINVTSPGGTTAAALDVLTDAEVGFSALLRRAIKAAAERGRELGKWRSPMIILPRLTSAEVALLAPKFSPGRAKILNWDVPLSVLKIYGMPEDQLGLRDMQKSYIGFDLRACGERAEHRVIYL